MRWRCVMSAAVVGVLVCSWPVVSGPQLSAVDNLAADAIKSLHIPGLSIALVRDSEVIYEKGFGSTSITEIRPATAGTQYRLASVTKVFTTIAILKLVEAGKIDLDQPARNYCGEISKTSFSPTVRQLMLHQGGIRHTSDHEDVTIRGAFPRLGAALTSVVKEPLKAKPGTKTIYSSWGYTVLGCVIESVSGKQYIDYLRDHLFAPAGMTSTTQDEPQFTSPVFSPGFRSASGGRFRPSQIVDTRFKASSSGLISSAHDLALFSIALYQGKLIKAETRNLMFEIPPALDDKLQFTFGWNPVRNKQFGQAYWFNGSMEGTTAIIHVVPARRYASVILANRERYVPELIPLLDAVNAAALQDGSALR